MVEIRVLCRLCESAQIHAFLSTGAQSHLIPTNPIESEGPYNLVGKILYQKEMQNETNITLLETILAYTAISLHSHFPLSFLSVSEPCISLMPKVCQSTWICLGKRNCLFLSPMNVRNQHITQPFVQGPLFSS